MENTTANNATPQPAPRKPYEKPTLTEVSLIKEINALATCKSAGYSGPTGTGCKSGVNACRTIG